MTNTPRLSKSGIEYLDYVWNFYSGCRHKEQNKCPPVPCWAEEITGRFKGHYPDGFNPHFYPEAFLSPLHLPAPSKVEGKKPARIGVCFMGDLFGDWIEPAKTHYPIISTHPDYPQVGTVSLITHIKTVILGSPQHIFVFLTKNPAGMIPWSPFPDNCEVGFSAWSPDTFIEGLRYICQVEAKVKWCSLEPLLDWNTFIAGNAFELLDWVAIGALTGNKKQIMDLAKSYPAPSTCSGQALTPWKLSASNNRWGLVPPYDWIKNIVVNCDAAGTKIFLKDNLYTWLMERPAADRDLYWEDMANLRQECGGREKK